MKQRLKNFIKKFPCTIYIYEKFIIYRNNRNRISVAKSVIPNLPKSIARNINQIKDFYIANANLDLKQFLFNSHDIIFPEYDMPVVSILLVLYNRAELTFSCLMSILQITSLPYEVIIVDNDSKDETKKLLTRIKNAKIILNDQNLHFIEGVNQGSKLAIGKMLLFLNNDATIMYGALNTAVKVLESNERNGAVGGKIILTDLMLQEAGSIFWNDGTCFGYGRNKNPFDDEFMFSRNVDFCSGAFLLTYTNLFRGLNGFDTLFKPAYYEEADYCLTLIEKGYNVVYDPRIAIKHFEFASSVSSKNALRLQTINRRKFFEKHKDWLAKKLTNSSDNVLHSRLIHNGKKILFIDERLPHIYFGAGYPRANSMIKSLLDLGAFVTMYPLYNPDDTSWHDVYHDIPRECEIMVFGDYSINGLGRFLESRKNYYDLIILSRPTTMSLVFSTMKEFKEKYDVPLVYDAESVFALKDHSEFNLINLVTAETNRLAIEKELSLCEFSDAIIAVTKHEGDLIQKEIGKDVLILGHACESIPTEKKYSERKDILFMGAIHSNESPNGDSLFWFIKEIFPIILKNDPTIKFHIIGTNKSKELKDMETENIRFHGFIEDGYSFFDSCRIFVVPTRYASGIPIKALTAASYGLPIVATSLIAKELNWSDKEIMSAETPIEFANKCLELYQNEELWNTIRKNSMNQILNNYSEEKMKSILKEILEISK